MKNIQFHQGLVLAALAAVSGIAGSAAAQQAPSSGPRSSFGPPSSAAPSSPAGAAATDVGMMRTGAVRHYQDSSSRQTFVVERRGNVFLLKFDNDPEIFVLHPTIGQGGDTFLRSDDGQLMLRVTEVGNMIAYFASQNGAPADMFASTAASAPSLLSSPPAMTASLTALLKDATQRLTKFTGHDVTIFGSSEFGDNEAWAADALKVIVKGVESADANSGRLVRSVRLQRSSIPSVTFKDGDLMIGVNPRDGYLGRLSSTAIAAVIAKAGG